MARTVAWERARQTSVPAASILVRRRGQLDQLAGLNVTCSVPKYSQSLPCPGLKVLFVPTLAKAQPDPKLSRVRVSRAAAGIPRGRGSGAKPPLSTGGWVLLFAPLQEKSMPVLAPQPRWGWWGRPSSSFAAACGRVPPPAAGPALSWSGQGAMGRREQEGGSRTRDPGVCPFCLMPVSLCFFDKNLKEERDGIRAMSRAGLGRC